MVPGFHDFWFVMTLFEWFWFKSRKLIGFLSSLCTKSYKIHILLLILTFLVHEKCQKPMFCCKCWHIRTKSFKDSWYVCVCCWQFQCLYSSKSTRGGVGVEITCFVWKVFSLSVQKICPSLLSLSLSACQKQRLNFWVTCVLNMVLIYFANDKCQAKYPFLTGRRYSVFN